MSDGRTDKDGKGMGTEESPSPDAAPKSATDILTAAAQQHRDGRLVAAEKGYLRVLQQDENNADAWHLLGVIALQQGLFESAVQRISRALEINATSTNFHNSIGDALSRLQRFEESENHFTQAIALNPSYFEAHYNFGNLLRVQGRREDALTHYRRALELEPKFSDAANNIGALLAEIGKVDEAETTFRDALKQNPDHPGTHNNLGNVLKIRGDLDDALAAYRRVTELAQNFSEGWRNRAATLTELGQTDEADAACRKALGLNPNDPIALDTLGNLRLAQNRADDALEAYDKALTIVPDFAAAQGNRALALLLRGDFERGWEAYEWRWQSEHYSSPRKEYEKPLWDGTPLDGKAILLHTEQGMGDAIQFVRYAPLVAERGGRVILSCQRELAHLFGTISEIESVVANGDLPEFDCHAPLMSLPRVFGTRADTIPTDIPYLKAESDRQARWTERLGKGPELKVGLAWRGSTIHPKDRHRSVSVETVRPILNMSGIRLFAMQVDAGDVEGTLPDTLDDVSGELSEFADTAACIAGLDLVISVDTAIAHLAGSLAKPVWILLPFSPDWRWMLEREDSPWYPSARLYRQTAPDDWQSVVERIATDLKDKAETGAS